MSPIAAQCWTIREQLKTPEQVPQTLARVREIGYEAVETGAFVGGLDARAQKAVLDQVGLAAAGLHVGLAEALEKPEEVLETLHHLGTRYATVSFGPDRYWSADGWKRLADELSAPAESFRRDGFTLAYHNHSHEFMRFGGRSGFEILVQESDPALALQIDTYWVAHGGADPVYWLKKLAGRIPQVHMKDYVISAEREVVFAEVGEGNLNWPAILEAAAAGGAEWYIVEQDRCLLHEPLESLAVSLRNMKSWGLG